MKNGKEIKLYPNGDTIAICNYKNDTLDGTQLFYRESGTLKEEFFYVQGLLTKWKIFDEKENLSRFTRYYYCGNDSIEKTKTYYGNGNISEEYSLLNGKENGTWIGYYENGSRKFEGHYYFKRGDDTLKQKAVIDDQFGGAIFFLNYYYKPVDGKWLYWHSNGKLNRIEYYDEGVKIYKWTYFNDQGEITKEEVYENGRPLGKK